MAETPQEVNDLLLFPHCDLHVAINGAPTVAMQVWKRNKPIPDHPNQYPVARIPFHLLTFSFFAPHNAVGHRLENLPTVRSDDDNTILMTATVPGIYLFQVRFIQHYLVGRLQVHRDVVDWWFGNDSITTAKDTFAHAQPSVYARFSDDPGTGTDLIGDITGHGYVQLTSSDPTRFTVTTPQYRLLGVSETPEPANPTDPHDPNHLPTLHGTFLNKAADIPVRVVDYAKARDVEAVRAPGFAHAEDMQNIVFLSEGFTAGDKDRFNEIVQKTEHDLFGDKPRHQPYGLLKERFNVFKLFAASPQRSLTCGSRVIDTPGSQVKAGQPFPEVGAPFPLEDRVTDGAYTVNELVARVGLPRRGEDRDAEVLRNLWSTQSLPLAFTRDKVSDALVTAWKEQRSTGILQARDTLFGLYWGRRLADRFSRALPKDPVTDQQPVPVDQPASDSTGDATLRPFVAQVYEFYQSDVFVRQVRNDPRRHPPELYANPDQTNPGNAIARFFGSLQYTAASRSFPVGQEWAPDDSKFQRSRGLVVLIALDEFDGGENINFATVTAQGVHDADVFAFRYDNPQDPRRMVRTVDSVRVSFGKVVDKVAHELGHSFNLGDENEDTGGVNPADASVTRDFATDNVAILGFIKGPATPGVPRPIDADKVKWLTLPRMRLSSRLVSDSQAVTGGIQVTVDPNDIGQWAQARAKGLGPLVSLRDTTVGPPPNKQLPQVGTLLAGLSIGDINQAANAITLTGAVPSPVPVFPRGSVVYVPLANKKGTPLLATDQHVLAHLRSTHRPLNKNTDIDRATNSSDVPEDVENFRAPCKPFRVIGTYEGAVHFAGGRYRPAGACKMRASRADDEAGEYCFVCKWLIVNRVDPGMHHLLTAKFYPNAKSSEDD